MKTLKRKLFCRWVMKSTSKVARADLQGYVPKRKMKALKKRLVRNNKKNANQSPTNDLNPAINLLYCTLKNKNKRKDRSTLEAEDEQASAFLRHALGMDNNANQR